MANNTFGDAWRTLLSYANRSSAEHSVEAKREVNAAFLRLNRHPFKFLERNDHLTYAVATVANNDVVSMKWTEFAELSSDSTPDVFMPMSLQKIVSAGNPEGDPIRMVSYAELQAMRRRFSNQEDLSNHQDSILGPAGVVAFFLNEGIGLYPAPESNVTLRLHYIQKVPELSADGDQNIFTKVAWDVVLLYAGYRFNIYLGEFDKATALYNAFKVEFEALQAWDNTLQGNIDRNF